MSFTQLSLDVSLEAILARFLINMLVLFILIRLIYYRFTKKADYLFSLFLLGIVIFFLSSVLETVEIQLGMALGLFAIFAILRFRTINFTVKDMTYVFIVIGVSIINSLANIPPPVLGAITINSIILITALILEYFVLKNSSDSFIVSYNNPELLAPEKESELIRDLSLRTGKKIEKARVKKMDLIKNTIEIEVFYKV